MFFYLKASSKDKKVLDNFVQFLLKLETSPVALKYFPKQKKRKFITILNSPHVNKTAQEQFEYRFYRKQFVINSFKPFSFFLLIKKMRNSSFPGLNLEVKGLFNTNQNTSKLLKATNPDNIILNFKQNGLDVSNKERYIQLFDCYGEIFLKNICYSKKST